MYVTVCFSGQYKLIVIFNLVILPFSDMWPETLEDENQKAPIDSKKNPIVSSNSTTLGPKVLTGENDKEDKKVSASTKVNTEDQSSINSNVKGIRTKTRFSNITSMEKPGKNQSDTQEPIRQQINSANQPPFPGPQAQPNMFSPGPIFLPNQPVQEMPLVFGPQPMVYLPLQPENMPLQFQNMPMPPQNMPIPPQNMPMPLQNMPMPPQNMVMPPPNMPLQPGKIMMGGGDPTAYGINNETMQPQVFNDDPNQRDLREELDKIRGHDNQRQDSSKWNDRNVTKKGEDWSRNVFEGGSNQQDVKEKGHENFQGQERNNQNESFQRNRRFSPERGRGRGRGRFMRGRDRVSRFSSPDRQSQRFSPERQDQRFLPQRHGHRLSSERQNRRFSPKRDFDRRVWSPERRERSPSYERQFPREPSREGFRDRRSISRSPSPYSK